MPKSEIIPFGKYKGQPVEVLAQDRDYCDWLMEQDWFRVKFQPIYTIIVNHFGEPADTPEHNQLQALFTDAEFCRKFVWYLKAGAIARHFADDQKTCLGARREKREMHQKQLTTERKWYGERPDEWTLKRIRELENDLKKIEDRIQAIEAMPAPQIANIRTTATFESKGIDVALEWTLSGCPGGSLERVIHVQCKPSLGDDYPAVLRQITASYEFGSWGITNVLLIGAGGYNGTGATLEQLRAIFWSRQVPIVFLEEIP